MVSSQTVSNNGLVRRRADFFDSSRNVKAYREGCQKLRSPEPSSVVWVRQRDKRDADIHLNAAIGTSCAAVPMVPKDVENVLAENSACATH